jgi:hypothetical protein
VNNVYIDWIDKQIEEYQREIVKLTIAREVVARAGKTIDGQPPKLVRAAAQKRGGSHSRIDKQSVQQLRGHIIAACDQNWLAPREIYASVHKDMPDMSEKRVWNALWVMRQKGMLIRNDEGLYTSTLKETIEALEKLDAA